MIGNFRQIEFFEHQAAGFEALAMAADAIFVDQRAGLQGCGRTGCGCGLLRARYYLEAACQRKNCHAHEARIENCCSHQFCNSTQFYQAYWWPLKEYIVTFQWGQGPFGGGLRVAKKYDWKGVIFE